MLNDVPPRHLGLIAYGAALVVALLWALVFPGWLSLRDMQVIDHPALSLANFGFGATPARNAPQDGVLAVIGQVVPASWVVRALLVATAAACAWGCSLIGTTTWGKAAAMTVGVYNPFVIERLLQGQWSLAIAAWLLPVIAASKKHPRLGWLALWVASLTPTGLLLGLITALVTGTARRRTLAIGVACSVPWLLPSVLAPPAALGTDVFVARAEHGVGTLGSLLGLGGIWNAQASLPSREAGWARFGVVLFALLATQFRRIPRALVLLAAGGLAACLFVTFGPTAWLVSTIPGAALFRDSHKLIALMIPALVAAAGATGCATGQPWRRRLLPAAVIVAALAQAPDAPAQLGALKPVSSPAFADHGMDTPRKLSGTALLVDPTVVSIDSRVMLNPWLKATECLDSGQLIVDGQPTETPNPGYVAARRAYDDQDFDTLSDMGVAWVIHNGQVQPVPQEGATDSSPAPRPWQWWLGLSLSLAWLLLGVLLVSPATRTIAREGDRSSQRP